MNTKLVNGLIAATTTFATLFSAVSAQAMIDVSQEQYDQQYDGVGEELLKLDYDTWKTFNDLVNHETNNISDSLSIVDLNTLRWGGGVEDVEVYFINEGATFRNQLFYSTDGVDLENGKILFEDVASPLSLIEEEDGPLALGQGESLGSFEANTFLEFFIKVDGANTDRNSHPIFGFKPEDSTDGLQHLIGYEVGEYILLGFEDISGGGDRDYNDVVFAVRGVVGEEVVDVPEPTTGLGLILLGGMGLLAKIKKKHNQV